MRWHHHMTLSLVALWFLCLERRHVGGKTPAVTVLQARDILAPLLRDPPLGPDEIARVVTRMLRRN